MKNSLRFLFTSLTMLAFGLTSCEHNGLPQHDTGNENDKLVTSVEFDTEYEQCEIGDAFQISATIHFKDDVEVENITKTWSSSKLSVARVDDTGYVEVVGYGTSYITLRAGYKMAKCTVYVPEPDTPTPGPGPGPIDPNVLVITLSTTSRTLEVGGSFSLTATPSKAADITFSVSDSSILKIDAFTESACSVVAQGVGEADVIATAEETTAKCHVIVVSKEHQGSKDYTIYFYIDYNNVDPKDDHKLLAQFDWYYDRPFIESGEVPTVTNDMALDPAFPYFIGWSTHPIIDTKDNLWDINNDTVADLPMVSYTVVLYGQWLDVPVLTA